MANEGRDGGHKWKWIEEETDTEDCPNCQFQDEADDELPCRDCMARWTGDHFSPGKSFFRLKVGG